MTTKSKKSVTTKNNPYPLSGRGDSHAPPRLSFSTPLSSQRSRHSSLSQSKHSLSNSHDSQAPAKSRAPTLSTTAETALSDAANSKAGTSATAAKTDGDRYSTFSSPAHSLRSMTTTLTTVQSAAAPLQAPNPSAHTGHASGNPGSSVHPPSHFSHQFPSSPPATAVPAHLAPPGHPTTYNTATANNILTDDASILTLASSSKRRRRNSLDTNASVRALAPASMFGGSRESLPLSVLSGTIVDPSSASVSNAPGVLQRNPGIAAERASLISSSGNAPALASERNSYLGKQGDGASVRSGLFGGGSGGHGRNDSFTNSIGGGNAYAAAPTSPLASPVFGSGCGNVPGGQGRVSRRSSGWGELPDGWEEEVERKGSWS